MDPTVTPQSLLAGSPSGNPAGVAMPSAPVLSGGAPESTAPSPDSTDLLSGLPPAPKPGGVSEDLRTQFMRNADKIIKQASDPSAPGAWAKALVGGVQSALAGVGNIGTVPSGGGALYGIGKVMQANQAEKDRKQEMQQRQRQESIDTDIKIRELQDREDAQKAASLANDYKVQDSLRHSTQGAQDEMYNKIYAPWKKVEEDSGAKVIQEGMTAGELQDLAKQHKDDKDPNGLMWLASQLRHQDGWRNVTDSNGDIVQQTDPRTGKSTGAPQRQATYSLMTYGEPLEVNEDIVNQAKKYLGTNLTVGTTLKPQDAALLKSQIGKAVVEEHAADEAALSAGTTKEKLAELQQKSDYRDAGKTFLPWINDAKGDPNLALANMKEATEEKDANGQPTPHAIQVQQQYDKIQNGIGPDIIKKDLDLYEKQTIENIKANATLAKNKPLEIEGDPSLEGKAYIGSLPAARQQIVQQMGTGRMPIGQMTRMASSKDGQQLLAEVAKAFPDFDGSKIAGYGNLVKEFNVGKTSNQIKAINTALPHLDDLYTAVNEMPSAALPGVGKIEAVLGSKTASMLRTAKTQAAQELASIYAAGAVTDKEHAEFEKELDTASPWELKNNIENIITLLNGKLNGTKEQWEDGAPSPQFKPPRRIISPESQGALDHIQMMKDKIQNPPPAAALLHVQEGQTTTFANGQTWTRQNSVPVLVNGAK